MSPQELKDFENWAVPLPSRQSHGLSVDDIAGRVERLTPTNWRLEGNRLIADTPMGPLVNYIPVDYILTGTDDKGLPILQKIAIP